MTSLTACRMCGGTDLHVFLDLGATPPADAFLRADLLEQKEQTYPLQVQMCDGCGLAQLTERVPPQILYQCDYPYESSTTRAGREHWSRFAQSVAGELGLRPGQLVVDIGSNVGALLAAFTASGMHVQGVDPASNIVRRARANGVDTICAFFDREVAATIAARRGRAALVTATNVFAHVDDLAAFMQGVQEVLAPDGTFIIEAPYFGNLVAYTEYDTIYHEHLSYLSIRPLMAFVERFGMEVYDVRQVEIHGGSFRVFVARRDTHSISPEVRRLADKELATGLHSRPVLDAFAARVRQHRTDLRWLLQRIKAEGKRIAAVSAPAKGMTLLNCCGIDASMIDFVTEKSDLKIGRYTPGTHIKVVPDAELLRAQPDYAILLAWNFADEIMTNLTEYRRRGGRFILPIPAPRIVS